MGTMMIIHQSGAMEMRPIEKRPTFNELRTLMGCYKIDLIPILFNGKSVALVIDRSNQNAENREATLIYQQGMKARFIAEENWKYEKISGIAILLEGVKLDGVMKK